MTGVDVAAFAVALGARLRAAGVEVSPVAAGDLVRALDVLPPADRDALYWAARLTLVRRHEDLAVFDAVFARVFGGGADMLDPDARRSHPASPTPEGTVTSRRAATAGPGHAWSARLAALTGASTGPASALPDPLPASAAAADPRSFTAFDPDLTDELQRWLDGVVDCGRRSRRHLPDPSGRRIALRDTITRSRRTGWEPMRVVRTGPVVRPRPVVVICDVSRSMLPFADLCLNLMRGSALRSRGRSRVEVFAFSTRPTRLTAVLARRLPDAALAHADRAVTDRFSGTRIAGSLRDLLASRHGAALRGAMVVIVSDGWDSDPPEDMVAVMARLNRRAHRVVWLNPRADAPGFRPLVGSMAAALAAAPPVRLFGSPDYRKGAQARSAYR